MSFSGCSFPESYAGNTTREAGYNYQVGGAQQTAYGVYEINDENNNGTF